jgi:hypothetical protein
MRLILVIAFASYFSALANPVPQPCITNLYIASERLVIAISPAGAHLQGAFSFRLPDVLPYSPHSKRRPRASILIPIWLAERNDTDPAVASFWQALDLEPGSKRRTGFSIWGNTTLSNAFVEAVGLRTVFHRFTVPSNFFQTTPKDIPTNSAEYVLNLFRFGELQEPGFHLLRCGFSYTPQGFGRDDVVTLSYRQPLAEVNGEKRFFYAPLFYNLPPGVVTTNTSIYSITLKAASDCDLTVSQGDREFTVAGGQSATIAPERMQKLLVTVKSRSNLSVQPIGASGSGGSSKGASSAAASGGRRDSRAESDC